MRRYTEECIDATKVLFQQFIDGTYAPKRAFNFYGKVYPVTNENISGYLPIFNMSEYKKALTVLSSGDHAFNLVHAGITDIDAFDCNRLTEYYALGLKRAMIMKYSYQEYLEALKAMMDSYKCFQEEMDIISDSLPFMDEEYRAYWKSLKEYAHNYLEPLQLSLLCLFCIGSEPSYLNHNNYLNSEKEYNLFKEKLEQANISFTNCDIGRITRMHQEYDVIMLSNVLDYFYLDYGFDWKYKILKNFESELLSVLSPNGVAFLNYIYHLGDSPSSNVIKFSKIRKKDITGENEAVIPFEWQKKGVIIPQTSGVLVLKRGIGKVGESNE